MNLDHKKILLFRVLLLLVLVVCVSNKKRHKDDGDKTCIQTQDVIKVKHKSCLLRPDTGPCRADILMWYFDAKQHRCYRFYWGGCQGNGNRHASARDCRNFCYYNETMPPPRRVPYFCSLAFDFGTCYGQYNRWTWDTLTKTCRRRLYSGCGGNQNNFETKQECMATCLLTSNYNNNINNNTMNQNQLTTCIPVNMII